jgi:hypothetical protein
VQCNRLFFNIFRYIGVGPFAMPIFGSAYLSDVIRMDLGHPQHP